MSASVRWHPEEQRRDDGSVRNVRSAWLVADGSDDGESQTRYLAYLGNRPQVTKQLREECEVLYPEIKIDWVEVARAIEKPPPVVAPDLEALAQHWSEAVIEQGYEPIEIEARIGRGRQRPLSDLSRLIEDAGVVGRIERTSGSIMAYMTEFHPNYAYAVAKLYVLLIGNEEEFERLEAEEPSVFRKMPRADQVKFWRGSVERIQHSLNS